MFPFLTFGTAMMKMSGEAWARQMRTVQVCQSAALQQMRVLWGLEQPLGMGNLCAPDTPARAPSQSRRTRADLAEMDDVPV